MLSVVYNSIQQYSFPVRDRSSSSQSFHQAIPLDDIPPHKTSFSGPSQIAKVQKPQSQRQSPWRHLTIFVTRCLIIGHPGRGGGGVTMGTYAGMARDLSTFFDNRKPGMEGLDCFCTFVVGLLGRSAGFVNIYKYL